MDISGSSKVMQSDSSDDVVFINYVSDPPSLQDMALLAFSLKVWGYPDRDVRMNDSQFSDSESNSDDDTVDVDESALQTLKKVGLPSSIESKVSKMIRPIGLQWVGWLKYAHGERFAKYCNLKEIYKEEGHWSAEGIVDVVRLLRGIFNKSKELDSNKISFNSLYESACMYCIEEIIPDLWLRLQKKKSVKHFSRSYHRHIVAYWTAFLNNDLPKLMSMLLENDSKNIYDSSLTICENLISSFIVSGNLIALKYFWRNKLTEQEKVSNIENWLKLVISTMIREYFAEENSESDFEDSEDDDNEAPRSMKYFGSNDVNFKYQDFNAHTYIMCFLLSHLSSGSVQRDIFRDHSRVILISLYYQYPLQRFFVPTFMAMSDFLPEIVFVEVMSKISIWMVERKEEVLFRTIWSASPLNSKKAFIRYMIHHDSPIAMLLSVSDNVTIDLILNDATSEEKQQILMQMVDEGTFSDFVLSNKLDISVVDSLVSRHLSSVEDIDSFKIYFMMKHAGELSDNYVLAGDFSSLNKVWRWAAKTEEVMQELKVLCRAPILYTRLIGFGKFEFVNDFLSWYCQTEEKISAFKKSYLQENSFNLTEWRMLLLYLSAKGKKGWEHFQKFINYNREFPEDIAQLKKVFAVRYKQMESFIGSNAEFDTLFKNWCSNSD